MLKRSGVKASRGPNKRASFSGPEKDIVFNSELIYTEREIWSPRHALWTRYHVSKPRQPNDKDAGSKWIDDPNNSPRSFSGFIGNHNQLFFEHLNNFIEAFEQSKTLPEVLVISGISGSGKSASARLFVQKLYDEMSLAQHQYAKWCMYVDANQYVEELPILWNKVQKFGENPMEKFIGTKNRLLVIDNFDCVPPSSQQMLKKVMMILGDRMKYLFICPEPKNCMISFIFSKASVVKTSQINERDCLTVILSILFRNNIGYELDGIKMIFQLHNDYSLSNMMNAIQKVFQEKQFISLENVSKVFTKSIDLPEITQESAIEPLERCDLCTLYPPCQHITLIELQQMGLKRRKELPRYKGGLVCPEFMQFGHCSTFNKYGHCSLDHPKNIHRIIPPLKRCTQCTIPWPCNHCAYSGYRNNLKSMIEEIHLRIGRLRQVNVPDPPLAFTKYLDQFPNWKEEIARIDRLYMKPENHALIKPIEEWINNAYSTNSTAYQNRYKQILDAFGDLYSTELLNVHRQKQQRQGSVMTQATRSTRQSMNDIGSISNTSQDSL